MTSGAYETIGNVCTVVKIPTSGSDHVAVNSRLTGHENIMI